MNPDIFEVTNCITPLLGINEVLITTDVDGNYRGIYNYADRERLCMEDLVGVEGKPNKPLYYLSDALGPTAAITNMNEEIIYN